MLVPVDPVECAIDVSEFMLVSLEVPVDPVVVEPVAPVPETGSILEVPVDP